MNLSGPRLGLALALTTAVLWGTAPIAGKLALAELSALDVTAWRVVAAAGGLALILLAEGKPVLKALRQRPWLALLAATALLGNYFLYMAGLALTTPTAAQVVVQLASVFLFLWGVVFFGERATPVKVGGIVLAVTGAVLVTWNGLSWSQLVGSRAMGGNLLVAAAAFSFSVYAALQKRLERKIPSMVVLAGVLLLGAVPAVPYAVVNVEALLALGALAAAALGYMMVATVGAYSSFAKSLDLLDASRVAVIVTFAPAVTLALDAAFAYLSPGLLDGDGITPWTVLGTALVVGGVLLVSREPAGKRETPDRRGTVAD